MAADNGTPRHRHRQEIDILQLISDAQSRWLKPIEVCEILRNHHKFKLSSDPADKPPSGSLYLYDRKALRYFRKDGHNWRKKKDGKTVREAHERLKAWSVDVLHCYYAHGEDNPNFQRRSYWLLEEPLEHIVLVHYREVTEGNRLGFGRATSSSPTCISTYGSTQGISHLTSSPSEGLSSSLNQDNDETESGEEFDNTCMAEFPQHVPYFQKQKKDMDHDMLTFSHTKNLEESETSSSSLFRASGGPSSTVSYSSSSSVNPCQQLTNLENQKIKTEYADLAALENMDFSELLLQTPSTQKLTTANTLDSASWKELLAGANDMADGKSDWNNLLNQVAHVTENSFRQSGANSSVNEALGSHGATGCTSQVSQGFLDVIFPNSFGGVPESRETDLPAATTETVYNNPALEYNKLLSWRTAPKQPDKVDQVKSQLPKERKSYTQDVEGCSQFPKLEEDKQQVQNLQKQDSFGTWLLKELDPLFGERMPAQSYWQTPQMQSGDGSKMSQQIPLDNSLGPSLSEKQLFSIIDFSPEWAYCSEGTKVIVTGIFLDTIKTQFDYHWGCVFGEVEVPAEVLQQGVLRCNAPPHTPGNVSFYVTCNNRIACNEQKTFEYRADPIDPLVFDRFPASESEEHDQREEEMLLQIRFASILSKHEDFPSTIAESGRKDLIQSANEQDWQQLAALVRAKKWLYEDAKEMLLQTMLNRELKQWIFLKENGKGKGVLYVDEQGQGVLHLAAALGYEWAIAPILAAGIGVNFRDANGWTSLHWAAYCGREKAVVALLAADASAGALTDPTPMYPAGRTAADLAASRGHGGIAGYLAETSLTSHLSSLKLNEAEGNRISGVVDGGNVVETVSERNIVPPSPGVSEDQLSLKDTLAALRNASQAAARIQSAFRAHSFRRRQDSVQHEVDEFGLSAEEACTLASKQMSQRASGGYHEQMHLAAMQIQCKFRGWKGRKDFLTLRDHVVKIQAHVRGHQVRKKYTKLIWTVGILDKAILRWRRKGQGLRGFRSESTENNLESDNSDNEEFFKDFRRQKEEGFAEELSRVRFMMQSAEARQQYRRMLESFQKAKGVPNVGDQVFDDEIMNLLG